MPIIIADIMSTRVVTVEMDDRLTVAKEIFDQASFHHLLVVDEYQLEGVLSGGICCAPLARTWAVAPKPQETLKPCKTCASSDDP